jgi:hypothetical protein
MNRYLDFIRIFYYTHIAQGLDTIQRIVSQPRPATASGPRKFDELFGSKYLTTTFLFIILFIQVHHQNLLRLLEIRIKVKRRLGKITIQKLTTNHFVINRFDDFDLTRPSTAPSPSDTLQNRSNTGVSSLRTGLELPKSSDIFPSTKTTTESSKSNDWLGLKDEPSDEDAFAPSLIQKIEPVVTTTLVKKTPTVPIQQTHPTKPEPPKKSIIDDLLADDRRELTEKTTQDFWLDERTASNKRPTAPVISKTSLFTDNQQIKSSTKPLFDAKTDFGILKIFFVLRFSFLFLFR